MNGVIEVGRLRTNVLPEDMQTLIWETMTAGFPDESEEHLRLRFRRSEIPILKMPLYFFPVINPERDGRDERDWESYAKTPIEEYPPIMIAHGKLFDGRHRLWAARVQDIREITAIDVSRLLPEDVSGLGWLLK